MPSEFAPPGGRPKVTKKQVQEMQENYQKAQALAEDTSEEEAKEKALVDELFEGELENAFMEDKKIGIYVGRFQPFHKGHENVLKQMLKENDTIIIFVGTGGQKAKNPFLFSEVKDFLGGYESDSSFIEEILDHESDEEWVKDLLGILSKYDIGEHTLQFYGGDLDSDSAIRSFKNYISKYYDGGVSYIEIPRDIFLVSIDNNDIALSATLCREALDRGDQNFLEQALPTRVFNNLNKSLL